jgi:hypothetical protein
MVLVVTPDGGVASALDAVATRNPAVAARATAATNRDRPPLKAEPVRRLISHLPRVACGAATMIPVRVARKPKK